MRETILLICNDHRTHRQARIRRLIRGSLMATAMRNKSSGGVVPQQFIQHIRSGFVRRVQQHTQTILHGFLAQLAGCTELVGTASVEVNLGHGINVVNERSLIIAKAGGEGAQAKRGGCYK